MITNFYIDAFNLYYGSLRGTPYKWLNLETLCQLSFPHDQVHRIRYFTARVKARPADPLQPVRQAMYLRALETLACVSIHYGHYLVKPVMMPYASPPPGGPTTVQVIKRKPSYHLSKVAAASPLIATANLAAAQFPATMTDAVGAFHKPPTW